MKDALTYFYSINVSKIEDIGLYKIVYSDRNNFLLKISTNINDIKVMDNEYFRQFFYSQNNYKLKINIFNEYITRINDDYVILIQLPSSYLDDINVIDIVNFLNKNEITGKYIDVYWNNLWIDKVDYLTNYIKNNESKYKHIISYIYYYLGIVENCILYLKDVKNKYNNEHVTFSITHRRMYYPLKEVYLFNPFNFVLDVKERDISEYIKSLYYNKEDYISELDYYLKTNRLNRYRASLLYIRIVYPSYFFDFIEGDSQYKINSFSNTSNYEIFIKKTYELINSYVNIEKIEWL